MMHAGKKHLKDKEKRNKLLYGFRGNGNLAVGPVSIICWNHCKTFLCRIFKYNPPFGELVMRFGLNRALAGVFSDGSTRKFDRNWIRPTRLWILAKSLPETVIYCATHK